MKTSIVLRTLMAAIVMLAFLVGGSPAAPEKPEIAIKLLLRTTLSSDKSKEVILASAEFPAGSSTGRHTHPGDEYATVLEGELEILIDGQPLKRLKTGESYHNSPGIIHETRNHGTEKARIVSTFVIDKGQPIMQPAP